MMATRFHDALGRSTGYAINGTRQTTIAYDSFGRISTMTTPTGSGVSPERSELRSRRYAGCVSPAQNEGDQNHCPPPPRLSTFQWAYLPGSDLKQSLTYTNGLTASWTYDANNQLLQVRNATPTNVISQFDYTYDAAGRRTAITKSGSAFGDLSGSIDSYTYNTRSELTSARRTKNGQPIPGFSEDFDYDPIGNRRSSATYNEKGEAQTSTYQANNLNQYTSRTTPGYAAVRGEAAPEATVTVNENPAFRLGSYYFGSDLFDNSSSGGFANLETYAVLREEKVGGGGEEENDLVSVITNQVYLAQSPESFAYDDDGNQTLITTKTGLWRVIYNGENRPIRWVRDSDNTTLTMSYDHMGRRRQKNDQRFFYEGYLQVADNAENSYAWDCTEPVATRPLVWTKNDLSSYYDLDGNKNVSEVIAADGVVSVHYEYAPFGAVIAHCGESSAANPWRFSSEYADDELGCDYYNYREYEPVTGRWMSEDGAEDNSVLSLYGFCSNRTGEYDFLGLWLGYRHKKLTKRAFKHVESLFAHPFGENISLKFDLEKIMDVIVDANVNTDSEDATADDQGYHYCTLVNENYNKRSHEKYRNQYTQYLRDKKKNYQDFLEPEKLDCKQALKVLGLLSHMWQDYYAHGVERDDSWFGAVIGKIKGSPDDPQMIPVGFGFKGFRGGHGGAFRLFNLFTRVEPGDRADDSDIRRRQAKWFTIEKFHKFLPVWVDACKCEKEWLAK